MTEDRREGPNPPGPPGEAGSLSWDELERRLAAALVRMAPETYLILATPAAEGHPGVYVQFAVGPWGIRAEAVSSHYLPPAAPLTADQEAALGRLGWQPPDTGSAGRNFFREWAPPAPHDEIAGVAVRTLRDVYRVVDPAGLRAHHQAFDGSDVPDLGLGLQPLPRAPRQPLVRVAAVAGPDLRATVEDGLRRWLGAEELVRDADGDYPIRVGSVLMFVRVGDGVPPVVQLFSPILRELRGSPALLDALNEINGRIRFGRAFATGRQVIVAMELTALDLTADQVAFACTELGNLADHLDDTLHGRFGGATMFSMRPTLLN